MKSTKSVLMKSLGLENLITVGSCSKLGQLESISMNWKECCEMRANLIVLAHTSVLILHFLVFATPYFSFLLLLRQMNNKKDAQMTEAQLLKTFDYAWNASGNGRRRQNDVLKKLEDIASRSTKFTIIARKLLLPFRQKQMGIKIETRKPIPTEIKPADYAEEKNNLFSRILNFSRSRPRLVADTADINGTDSSSCGVVIGYGVVCKKPPVDGRKRCTEHKGMRINGLLKNSSGRLIVRMSVDVGTTKYGDRDLSGINAETSYNTEELEASVSDSFSNKGNFLPICGVVLCDGSPCRRPPVQGRKRCEEHKGRRIRTKTLISSKEAKPKVLLNVITSQDNHAAFDYKQTSSMSKPEPILIVQGNSSELSDLSSGLERMCGVDLGNGLYCTRPPVKGRVRCGEHKGMRTNGLISRLATSIKPAVSDTGSVC